MPAEALASGLVGALLATILAIFYQHLSLRAQQRAEVMLHAVEFLDNVYYEVRNIHSCKDHFSRKGKMPISEGEYRSLQNRLDASVTSSHVHARVALAYGQSSPELYRFNQLRDELRSIALMLFQADASSPTWNTTSDTVHQLFNDKIEPLRRTTETRILAGATMCAVFKDIVGFRRDSGPGTT